MAVLEWDRIGSHRYETGIDKGVVYWKGRPPVAWHGLISVDEQSERESKSYYLDGVKYLETVIQGDYSAQVKAYSYPDQFNILDGVAFAAQGVFLHDQPPRRFGLSYRTLMGTDREGTDYGYKIHIVYDALAIPDSRNYTTKADQTTLSELGWTIKATPQLIPNFRPTAHVTLESTSIDPDLLHIYEDKLYGTSSTPPQLPSLQQLMDIATEFYAI